MTSYHISNLGSLAGSVASDLDGYVHLTPEGWLNAPMDWGCEADNERDSEEERAAKAEWRAERCEEMAADAVAATAAAEARVAEWRKS